MDKNTTYKPTLEQLKPYMGSVTIKYDTRPNWGSPDVGSIREAMQLTGFKSFKVQCWESGKDEKKWEYDMEVDVFLMYDYCVQEDGIYIFQEDGIYCNQIQDWRNVRNRLKEVIRTAYILADKTILVSASIVDGLAKSSFKEMLEHWRYGQSSPRHSIVTLTPIQWENICRMKSPQAFKGKPSRMYVHDPWITAEVDEAVVWEVEVWQWEGNRHWTVNGQCVFVKEGTKPKYTEDYPMDYWD